MKPKPTTFSLEELIDGCLKFPAQGGNSLSSPMIREMIQCDGPLNSHLEFPSDPTELSVSYLRNEPLPLTTPIYGVFLVLSYCGHVPELVLTEHSSTEEMKNKVLSHGGGILNAYTDAQFAFREFRPYPFKIQLDVGDGEFEDYDMENRFFVPGIKSNCNYSRCEAVRFNWLDEGAA